MLGNKKNKHLDILDLILCLVEMMTNILVAAGGIIQESSFHLLAHLQIGIWGKKKVFYFV